jgi:hypothetical protein
MSEERKIEIERQERIVKRVIENGTGDVRDNLMWAGGKKGRHFVRRKGFQASLLSSF